MAEQLKLEVVPRESTGTSSVGRLRRADDAVPGVVYGAGVENVNIALPSRVLAKAIQDTNLLSQIIELNMGDASQQVVVRDIQRHPATEKVTHIDFLRVREDQEIVVAIPVRFLNEEACVGVKLGGGTISHNLVEVEVSCLPKNLPESLSVDMTDIDVGQSIHLSDLDLPEGVSIPGLGLGDDSSRDLPVASVAIIRVQEEEVDEVEEELVEGEVVEGEAEAETEASTEEDSAEE